jgi:hypothetical protein
MNSKNYAISPPKGHNHRPRLHAAIVTQPLRIHRPLKSSPGAGGIVATLDEVSVPIGIFLAVKFRLIAVTRQGQNFNSNARNGAPRPPQTSYRCEQAGSPSLSWFPFVEIYDPPIRSSESTGSLIKS